MQTDHHYPALADRRTPQEWREQGAVDLLETARRRTRDILAAPHPRHLLGRAVDGEIRRRFPIRLPVPNMTAPTIAEAVRR